MMENKEVEEKALDKKDITYDILIDDVLEDDRERPAGGPASAGPAAAGEDQGDHPVLTILDMAVKQSGVYLSKQGLPPANNAVYESFSKPFLNEACWHYLPDGSLPDDPRFALVLGVAGLGLAFAPTLIALYERKEAEEKRQVEEEKRRKERRREEAAEEEKRQVGIPMKRSEARERSDVPPGPVADPPDWLERLEGGALSGI